MMKTRHSMAAEAETAIGTAPAPSSVRIAIGTNVLAGQERERERKSDGWEGKEVEESKREKMLISGAHYFLLFLSIRLPLVCLWD